MEIEYKNIITFPSCSKVINCFCENADIIYFTDNKKNIYTFQNNNKVGILIDDFLSKNKNILYINIINENIFKKNVSTSKTVFYSLVLIIKIISYNNSIELINLNLFNKHHKVFVMNK